MLHSHPRIAVPPETRIVIEAYRRHHLFGDLREPSGRRALAQWVVRGKGTKFRDLGLDTEKVVEEIVAAPATLGSCLRVPFVAYARRFGAARWGDKRPSYFYDVPAVLRLFPDAQLVHLVRDGRDAVSSLRRTPWFKGSAADAAAIWAEAVDKGARHARRLRSDQWHELRYEDLVSDPEPALRRLCAFLGEEFEPDMCRPDRVAGVAVPERKSWHARTRETPSGASVGTYASSLSPEERVLVEYVLAGRLRARGYETPSKPVRPGAAALASYARAVVPRLAVREKWHLEDRWRDRRSGAPLAAIPGPHTPGEAAGR
jgi:hypothetical protein